MIVHISSDAEGDLAEAFWFYERQENGLGDRFRCSIKEDIRSLEVTGGSHSTHHGYHRMICRKFPFTVFYRMDSIDSLFVIAVFGQRQEPNKIAKRLENE